MNDFSAEKWNEIKKLAARLQVVKSLLDVFTQRVNDQPLAQDLRQIENQLRIDFDQTLDALIQLIESDDD